MGWSASKHDDGVAGAGAAALAEMFHLVSAMPIDQGARLVKALLKKRGIDARVFISSDGVLAVAIKMPGKDSSVHGAA